MPELEIIDCKNAPIIVGAKIDGGNGVEGEVVLIEEPDEGRGPTVGVLWPDADAWERFDTAPRNYRREGPSGPYVWKADEIEVIG